MLCFLIMINNDIKTFYYIDDFFRIVVNELFHICLFVCVLLNLKIKKLKKNPKCLFDYLFSIFYLKYLKKEKFMRHFFI